MKYRDHVTLNEVVRRAITNGVLKIITLYDSIWNSKMAALVQIDSRSFRWLFVLVVSLPCIKSFSFDLQKFHLLYSLHVRHTYCHRPSEKFVYVF
jgi:hypothetical protein